MLSFRNTVRIHSHSLVHLLTQTPAPPHPPRHLIRLRLSTTVVTGVHMQPTFLPGRNSGSPGSPSIRTSIRPSCMLSSSSLKQYDTYWSHCYLYVLFVSIKDDKSSSRQVDTKTTLTQTEHRPRLHTPFCACNRTCSKAATAAIAPGKSRDAVGVLIQSSCTR